MKKFSFVLVAFLVAAVAYAAPTKNFPYKGMLMSLTESFGTSARYQVEQETEKETLWDYLWITGMSIKKPVESAWNMANKNCTGICEVSLCPATKAPIMRQWFGEDNTVTLVYFSPKGMVKLVLKPLPQMPLAQTLQKVKQEQNLLCEGAENFLLYMDI